MLSLLPWSPARNRRSATSAYKPLPQHAPPSAAFSSARLRRILPSRTALGLLVVSAVSLVATLAYLSTTMVVIIEKHPTKAKPETVFKIWTDVVNWKKWDVDIETSTLDPADAAFENGAKGVLQMTKEGNLKGARYDFVIANLVKDKSFAYDVHAPGSKMRFFFDVEVHPASSSESTPSSSSAAAHTAASSSASPSNQVICGAELTGPMGWLYKIAFNKMFCDTMHACAAKLSEQAEAIEADGQQQPSSA